MKKIQSWETFNELNRSSYFKAAKKAEELGNKKLSDRFKDHSDFIENIQNKNRIDKIEKRFSSIEPFKFTFTEPGQDIEHKLTGKYLGIDPGMMWDVFLDNEGKSINISILFKMEEEDLEKMQEPDIAYIMPFFIYYNIEKLKLEIDGPYNVEESFLGDYTSEGEGPILFNNRKDANRLISLLKSEVAEEFEEVKNKYIKPEEVDEYENMINLYDKAIDKIHPRQLYR